MKKVIFIIFTLISAYMSGKILAQELHNDTSKVLLTFSQPMSRDGIFNVDNYQIYRSDSSLVKIYKVGIAKGDTLIVLFTEKQSPKAYYKIVINNLKDKFGNLISANHKTAIY